MRIAMFALAGVIVGGVLLPAGLYYLTTAGDAQRGVRRGYQFEGAFICCLGFVGLSGSAGGLLGGVLGRVVDRRAQRRGQRWDLPTVAVAVFLLGIFAWGVVLYVRAYQYIQSR